MMQTKQKVVLYIAWIQAVVATAGSLFLSLGLGWTPCVLCWYQRTMMYPLVLVIGALIVSEAVNIDEIVLPVAVVGWLVSVYQNLLMFKILPESAAPCMAGISCTIPYHLFATFLTVPLLSFIAFTVIIICMITYRVMRKRAQLSIVKA
jgi:disulfide bond formation protein DsbB